MKYIKNRNILLSNVNIINENKLTKSDIINDICVAMSIINPDFLSPILDKGLINRYTQNSTVFLNDLKTLLFKNTKLKIGRFKNGVTEIDTDVSVANKIFDMNSFNIEKDWNMLINSRNIARNIYDKLLYEDKLQPEMVKYVYWMSPNKEIDDSKHDITIELEDGRQFNIIFNRTVNMSGTIGFSSFCNILLQDDFNKIYSNIYVEKWDKLVQEWVRLSYENANTKFRSHMERFISLERISSIKYDNYYDIRNADPNKKILGEEVPELDMNYTHLYNLLADMYKKQIGYTNFTDFNKKWASIKKITLNSNIIEDFIYNQFEILDTQEKEKGKDNKIKAKNKLKLNFIKVFANILKCDTVNNQLFFTKNSHINLPSRKKLKELYKNMDIMYKIHNDVTNDESNSSDYIIEFDLYLNTDLVCGIVCTIGYINEMDKLSVKYKIKLSSDFNYKINK